MALLTKILILIPGTWDHDILTDSGTVLPMRTQYADIAAVRDTFDHVEGPVVRSAGVADRLGCARETARRKLETLHDRGDPARRKGS
jgi:hypothetical protein